MEHTRLILMVALAVAGSVTPAWATPQGIQAVSYTDINAGLQASYTSAAAWADYDNDGDLDVAITGAMDAPPYAARIYRNDGPFFTDILAPLHEASYPCLAWGDYDNDGDVDLLLAGADRIAGGRTTRLYRNDGADVFTPMTTAIFPGISTGSCAWGDYDNDGDLDVLLTGFATGGAIAAIYRNNHDNTFTDIAAGLVGLRASAGMWADYDNDGDLDVAVSGNAAAPPGFAPTTRIYRNDGSGSFADAGAGLLGLYTSALDWGDFDNDGDLDLLATGNSGTDTSPVRVTKLYRNDGAGVFVDVASTGMAGVAGGSAAWGDMDNDGDVDALLTGYTGTGGMCRAYRNNGDGTFTNFATGLTAVWYSSAQWGDFDHDGDLDIVLVGTMTGDPSGDIARIYRSAGAPPVNTAPAAPTGLSSTKVGDVLILSWSAATDTETPSAGLTYNLRVGTTPGGSEIISAMAHPTIGLRRLPQLGNAQKRTTRSVKVPNAAAYYWSVQAIDAGFVGSAFAAATADAPSNGGRASLQLIACNPCRGQAEVTLVLPSRMHVAVHVYDAAGRKIGTLLDEERPVGRHAVAFRSERPVQSGLYFVVATVDGGSICKRMVLLQ